MTRTATPGGRVAVSALRPVSLVELDAIASLQTRVDRKYVVPCEFLDTLLDGLVDRALVLEIDGIRAFRYESIYFDTPDLRMYLAAARGRPRRVKVRTRTYLDSGTCMLEVKTRDARGRTVKHRRPHPAADGARLTRAGQAFVSGFEGLDEVGSTLRPTLTTRFIRSTLLVDDGAARVTVDSDLTMRAPDGSHVGLPGRAVIETKAAGGPTAVDRILWAGHFRPVRVSKYGAGLAALRPDLPGNRWSRVVRHTGAATGGRVNDVRP